MTPTAFNKWLAAMKAAGLSRSDAAAARALGVTPTTIRNYKRNGAGKIVSLACRALFARLDAVRMPWDENHTGGTP